MKVKVEHISSVRKVIEVEVPPERVTQELDQAYRGLQQRARIKGFRAGHVPRPVLERYFANQVKSEVLARLVKESYTQILDQHGLLAVTQPEIVTEGVEPGKALRYTVTVEVKPETTVRDYTGIAVEREAVHVGEEDIEEVLHHLRESLAQLHSVAGRERVERGDMVSADIVGRVNDRVVESLSREDFLFEVGRGTLSPSVEEHFVGARKGHPFAFAVPFSPHDSPVDMAGRTVQFHATVKDILRKELPSLDDDFAKDHGECATLGELREKIRRDLEAEASRRQEMRVHEALLTRLLERNSFEVPRAMVERQREKLRREIDLQSRARGRPTLGEATPAAVEDELTRQAERRVRATLLLEAVARQEGLGISDEEVEQRVKALLAHAREHRRHLLAFYRRPENREELRGRILQEKAMAWLIDRAEIKTVERNVAPLKGKSYNVDW